MVKQKEQDYDLYEELSKERKHGQEEGVVPEWMTTGGYQLLKNKYLEPGDTPKDRYRDIANTAANYAAELYGQTKEEWSDTFFDMMWDGFLSPSTPVLANMSEYMNRGCSVSCSGGMIDDSIKGFYDARTETAILTQEGFGTSSYLGNIRPRGTKISRGGKASGSLPVLKGFIQDMRDVSQGNTRRGAWAGYQEVDHKDFWETATFLYNNPDDFNLGWCMRDDFFDELNNGSDEALRKWKRIMKIRSVFGKGYMFFTDKVNRLSPQMYKDFGLEVKASNLCFTGDTMVAVADGRNAVSIKELAMESNGKINIPVYSSRWSDYKNVWVSEIKNSVAFKTGHKKIIKVYLSDGSSFKCTPDHKLALPDGTYLEAQNAEGRQLQQFFIKSIYKPDSVVVESIVDCGYEDVYDLTVEDNHNFNIITSTNDDDYLECSGILVHNCSEIMLFSDKDHTFTCVLSSLNLTKWDQMRKATIFNATVFLDCVCEHFIRQGSEIPGLENAVRFTKKGRALGLGVLGFHTYLQEKMLPFDSFQAHSINSNIFKKIDDVSLEASQWMAKQAGEPEWCQGYGVRNTHRMAIAPTMSTATIVGGVSQGIEPFAANAFNQGSAAGEIPRINPVLLKIMKERSLYEKRVIDDIIDHDGSVQHVDWLSDDEKQVFKTAYEIDQGAIIRLASARGRYIDQGQSLNLFFDADEEEEYVSQIHKMAALDPYIKSLYYMRSMAGVQASKGECAACEG